MGKVLPLFSVLDTRRDIRALRGRLISTLPGALHWCFELRWTNGMVLVVSSQLH